MKNIKEVLKNNIKVIVAFIVGFVMATSTVFAAEILFNSVNVGYDNTTSGLASTDVQNALDELNTKANTWINPNNNFGTPQYYAFGRYKGWCSSTDTICNSNADFPTTDTTPPSGKTVYAAYYSDDEYGVCIKRNGTEHCFRGRNWITEAQHVQKVFSDISCTVYSARVKCYASDFGCDVFSNGAVVCRDYGASVNCSVSANGDVICNG